MLCPLFFYNAISNSIGNVAVACRYAREEERSALLFHMLFMMYGRVGVMIR